MNWLKKAYQDRFNKWMTIVILIGGPVFSGLMYLANDPNHGWWQAWAFAWGMYVVILFLFYILRNAK